MKIKTFNNFLNDAETAINKFLEDKKFVDIKTDTVIHNGKIFTHYTVVYEDGGKTEEVPVQTTDGVTTYTRAKGSNEPFLKMIGQADYGSGESVSMPFSSNPKHHHPHWLDGDCRQSSEWPKEWARQVKNNKWMGRFE